jgi:hypothetical protein
MHWNGFWIQTACIHEENEEIKRLQHSNQPSQLKTGIFHVEIPFIAWYFCLEETIKICNTWLVVYDFSKYMLPSTYTIFKIYFHPEINKNYHYSVKNNSKSVIFWFEEISENTILDHRTFKMRFCVSISCCWNTYHQYNKKKVNHQNLWQ